MRALKALVIFMGILIILGISLLAYGLIVKLGKAPISGQEESVSLSPLAPTVPGGRLDITAPHGSRFEQMEIANSRVVLRFATQDAQILLFVDPLDGKVTGPIVIAPVNTGLRGQ